MAFNLFSVKIRIEYSLFILISAVLILGYNNILTVLLFSSLHELGHVVTLLLVGGSVDEITLSYYGIGMRHSSRLTPIKESFFLSGGIIVNLLFYFLSVEREVNFALAFINALPLYPLDGGRLLKSALCAVIPVKTADIILLTISITINVFLIAMAIIFKNISLLLISLYTAFYSINITRYL